MSLFEFTGCFGVGGLHGVPDTRFARTNTTTTYTISLTTYTCLCTIFDRNRPRLRIHDTKKITTAGPSRGPSVARLVVIMLARWPLTQPRASSEQRAQRGRGRCITLLMAEPYFPAALVCLHCGPARRGRHGNGGRMVYIKAGWTPEGQALAAQLARKLKMIEP